MFAMRNNLHLKEELKLFFGIKLIELKDSEKSVYFYQPKHLIMKSSEKLCWVYMTAGSIEEAKNIGQKLVEQNLVACVNLLENMISIYKWEDKLEEGQEVVMIAKTRKILMPKLIETVNSLHSYDCPCILELPIQGGNPEFLSWIEKETT